MSRVLVPLAWRKKINKRSLKIFKKGTFDYVDFRYSETSL